MKDWSRKLKDLTLTKAGDGCTLKCTDGRSGMFVRGEGSEIKIMDIILKDYFMLPGKNLIASFNSIDEMIEAGWVID